MGEKWDGDMERGGKKEERGAWRGEGAGKNRGKDEEIGRLERGDMKESHVRYYMVGEER